MVLLEREAPAAGEIVAPPNPAPSVAPLQPKAVPQGAAPADLARARTAEARSPIDRSTYATVRTAAELAAWIARAEAEGVVAVDAELSSIDPMRGELIGLSMAVKPGEACYIPIGHRVGADDLFGGGALVEGQIAEPEALALLKPLLEAPGVLKLGHDIKLDAVAFAQRGIALAPFDDTLLISYALDGGLTGDDHSLDALGERTLGHKTLALSEVAGSGRNFVGFARVPIDRACEYAAENADMILRLWRVLKPRLAAEAVTSVYERLERPLVQPLARMERRGITIDRDMLSRLSGEFAQGMGRLEDEVAKLVGAPFNLGSPKQLGDILFGQMGLPGGKKTATGAWSTTASVLEDLAAEGHAAAGPRARSGGNCRNSSRPTPTPCRASSIRRPDACIRPTRSRPPPPGACRRPSPTCRTSPSAPRRAARSAAPSSRRRAASSSRPTTARSSCACSLTSPTFRL